MNPELTEDAAAYEAWLDEVDREGPREAADPDEIETAWGEYCDH